MRAYIPQRYPYMARPDWQTERQSDCKTNESGSRGTDFRLPIQESVSSTPGAVVDHTSRGEARVVTQSDEARRPSSSTTKRVSLLEQWTRSLYRSSICWTPTSHTSSNLQRRTFVQTRSAGQPTTRGNQAPAIKRRRRCRRCPPPRPLAHG